GWDHGGQTLSEDPKGIHCPHCGSDQNKVTDSRPSIANTTRRRRKCLVCGTSYRTREHIDQGGHLHLKQDNPGVFVGTQDLEAIRRELLKLFRLVGKIKRTGQAESEEP